MGSAAPNRIAMINTLVHHDRYGSGISVDAHSQRVAHQQHIQSGCFGKLSGGVVIGGQKRDFVALPFHPHKIMNHFFLCHLRSPF
jgi:hypothetical protein